MTGAGTLYSRRELDRETQPSFSFVVVGRDGGGSGNSGARHSATATLSLTVTDVNDQAPEFVSSGEAAVAENSPANTAVATLLARDRDEGINGEVEYFLQVHMHFVKYRR